MTTSTYPVSASICENCAMLSPYNTCVALDPDSIAMCKAAGKPVWVPTYAPETQAPENKETVPGKTTYANPPQHEEYNAPELGVAYPCTLKFYKPKDGQPIEGYYTFYVNTPAELNFRPTKIRVKARDDNASPLASKRLALFTRNICSVYLTVKEATVTTCVWLLSHTKLRNEYTVTYKLPEGKQYPYADIDFGIEK